MSWDKYTPACKQMYVFKMLTLTITEKQFPYFPGSHKFCIYLWMHGISLKGHTCLLLAKKLSYKGKSGKEASSVWSSEWLILVQVLKSFSNR